MKANVYYSEEFVRWMLQNVTHTPYSDKYYIVGSGLNCMTFDEFYQYGYLHADENEYYLKDKLGDIPKNDFNTEDYFKTLEELYNYWKTEIINTEK